MLREAPKVTNRIPAREMPSRSISISLDESLLAQLDTQGPNRSALVSAALTDWLAHRRIDALNAAYADLATLDDGDPGAAGDDAAAMA